MQTEQMSASGGRLGPIALALPFLQIEIHNLTIPKVIVAVSYETTYHLGLHKYAGWMSQNGL